MSGFCIPGPWAPHMGHALGTMLATVLARSWERERHGTQLHETVSKLSDDVSSCLDPRDGPVHHCSRDQHTVTQKLSSRGDLGGESVGLRDPSPSSPRTSALHPFGSPSMSAPVWASVAELLAQLLSYWPSC